MKASNSLRHGLCRSTILTKDFWKHRRSFCILLPWQKRGLVDFMWDWGETHLWLWFGAIWWWFPSSQLPGFLFLVLDLEHTCLLCRPKRNHNHNYRHIYTHTLDVCFFFSEPHFHAFGLPKKIRGTVLSNYIYILYSLVLYHVKGFHNHFGMVCFRIGFHFV